jgi:hypothetical protein
MTVFQELAVWLKDILDGIEAGMYYVDLEYLAPAPERGVEPAALMSSLNDSVRTLIGGLTRKYTKYKTLNIRRDVQKSSDRISNEAFFDRLQNEIYQRDLYHNLPCGTDSRSWKHVIVESGAVPAQRSDKNDSAVYSVTLKIIYTEYLPEAGWRNRG